MLNYSTAYLGLADTEVEVRDESFSKDQSFFVQEQNTVLRTPPKDDNSFLS